MEPRLKASFFSAVNMKLLRSQSRCFVNYLRCFSWEDIHHCNWTITPHLSYICNNLDKQNNILNLRTMKQSTSSFITQFNSGLKQFNWFELLKRVLKVCNFTIAAPLITRNRISSWGWWVEADYELENKIITNCFKCS